MHSSLSISVLLGAENDQQNKHFTFHDYLNYHIRRWRTIEH